MPDNTHTQNHLSDSLSEGDRKKKTPRSNLTQENDRKFYTSPLPPPTFHLPRLHCFKNLEDFFLINEN